MITHIEGIIEEKNPAYVILDVNGVGYFLNISLNTYSALPAKGKVRLFTHLAIKEDAHLLYGFVSNFEREMFRLLISVSGVGASIARMMLSSLSAEEISIAIANKDVALLKKIKGIGAKSAERIVIDLKDKVQMGSVNVQNLGVSDNTIRNEALSALAVLGIDKKKAELVVDKSLSNAQNTMSVEELVKITLKSL